MFFVTLFCQAFPRFINILAWYLDDAFYEDRQLMERIQKLMRFDWSVYDLLSLDEHFHMQHVVLE
jgi:hypothetical protein